MIRQVEKKKKQERREDAGNKNNLYIFFCLNGAPQFHTVIRYRASLECRRRKNAAAICLFGLQLIKIGEHVLNTSSRERENKTKYIKEER